MKKNSKGFMLIDTLIVSISVSAILIYLYFQFANVNDYYNKSLKYNTVEGLYAGYDVKENLKVNGKPNIYQDANNSNFVDLSACPDTYYNNTDYCNTLYDLLNIKTVLITKANLSAIQSSMQETVNINKYDETLREIIKKSPNETSGYQLFIEFKDSAAAVVIVKE